MPNKRLLSPIELYEQIRSFQERQQRMMARAIEARQHGLELLRQPRPDTFLGRQHYELIALPEDTMRDRTKRRMT